MNSLRQGTFNDRERSPAPQKEKGVQPDFIGNGVAVWVNEKDGKEYLSITILGSLTVVAFPNKKKEGH